MAPGIRARSTWGVTLLAGTLAAGTLAAPAGVRAGDNCTSSSFPSADVPKAIPSPPGIAESERTVVDAGPVHDINVKLDISHPFDSDLTIELVAPSGESVTLAEGVGTWGNDFIDTTFDDEASTSIISALPPFTGGFRPQHALSGIEGGSRSGTWKLRVTDRHGGYDGTIDGWSLEIAACTDVPVEQPPEAGAPMLPPLPAGFPAGPEEIVGTPITVATSSDVSDGDTSSVSNLQADPGVDGAISLREAIAAANNDPGAETIAFAPALLAGTITVGATPLPALEDDSGVFINGDIDANGDPDVTIADGASNLFGLISVSSNNRLHALGIQGFANAGVLLRHGLFVSVTGQTLERNTLSGLAIEDGEHAVVQSDGGQGTQNTANTWLDTRMVGNTIEAEQGGLDVRLHHTTGDSVDRTTLAGNTILIDDDGSLPSLFGVAIGSGLGSDSDSDTISEALIAYNSIAGTPESAFFINAGGAGDVAGTGNVVEDIRLIGNRAELEPGQMASGGFGTSGVLVLAGDDFEPSEDDITRRIEVSGNLIDGYGREGIRVMAACCGATGGLIEDVLVEDNVVNGSLHAAGEFNRGIAVVASGGNSADPGANEVSDVAVRHNSVNIENPQGFPAAELMSGGIVVSGGDSANGNGTEAVLLADNRIETELVGVSIFGGFGAATGNAVSDVDVRGNLVLDAPTLVSDGAPGVKGISVIGGTGPLEPGTPGFGSWQATGNTVSCVRVDGNLVAGVLDDFSLFDNVGAGASGNTATFAGCGGNDFPVQFSAAAYSVAENAGRATITVTRSAGAGPGSVNYATSDGTADGSDYTGTSGTLGFAAGETSRTFDVAVTNDVADEPGETMNLTLSSASGDARLGAPRRAVLTIEDDDPAAGAEAPPGTPPPPPGTPPPPTPLSDTSAPVAALGGRAVQRVLRQRAVIVSVQCVDEPCSVVARGRLNLPTAARIFTLRSVRRMLPRGVRVRLRLTLPKRALPLIQRALSRRRRVVIRVTVAASDPSGNSRTVSRTVRARR